MFVGSLAYILFIGANLKPIAGLMFPASVLLGMGAALLWSAQGVRGSPRSFFFILSEYVCFKKYLNCVIWRQQGYLARWSNDENLGMLSGLVCCLALSLYLLSVCRSVGAWSFILC